MRKFDDYDKTEVKDFDFRERLSLGGHICKILEVKTDTYNTKDGKECEQLILRIDIAEPDEQAGFYQRRFAEDAKVDALKAKWKCFYKITIPDNNSEDFIKSTFKTLITSIEKSNPGYVWNWEENTLVGKVFGGVFGYEEFVAADGKVIPLTKCRFARSIESVKNAPIPKVRLADKTFMDYDDYIEKKEGEKENNTSSQSNTNSTPSEFSKINSDDDLPF